MSDLHGSRVLMAKQKKIVALMAAGLKNVEIGKKLGTTEHVVKNYVKQILDKLGFDSRLEVALWYEARRKENAL